MLTQSGQHFKGTPLCHWPVFEFYPKLFLFLALKVWWLRSYIYTRICLTTSASKSSFYVILKTIVLLNLSFFIKFPCAYYLLVSHSKVNEARVQRAQKMKQDIENLNSLVSLASLLLHLPHLHHSPSLVSYSASASASALALTHFSVSFLKYWFYGAILPGSQF